MAKNKAKAIDLTPVQDDTFEPEQKAATVNESDIQVTESKEKPKDKPVKYAGGLRKFNKFKLYKQS